MSIVEAFKPLIAPAAAALLSVSSYAYGVAVKIDVLEQGQAKINVKLDYLQADVDNLKHIGNTKTKEYSHDLVN